MVKPLLIALIITGSIVTVPLVGVYLFLDNSGCPPTLMLSVVNSNNYYVQQGWVKNVTNSDLDVVPFLQKGIENLLTNPDSLYTQELTNSEISLLYEFFENHSFDVLMYNDNYINVAIAVC